MHISNTIVNDTEGQTVAYARQILDETEGKKQDQINRELREALSGIVGETDIERLDFTTSEIGDVIACRKPSFYRVTESGKSVGVMFAMSDSMGHVVTQVLYTNYLLTEDGQIDISLHVDDTLFTYIRRYNTGKGPLEQEAMTWSAWEEREQSDGSGGGSIDTALIAELQKEIQDISTKLDNLESGSTKLSAIINAALRPASGIVSGMCMEIAGGENAVDLSGAAITETFSGDRTPLNPTVDVALAFSTNGGTLGAVTTTDTSISQRLTLPQEVGRVKVTLTATKSGVVKSASESVSQNLRKHFSFLDADPASFTELLYGASHFSDSVACTVTVPASGEGYKHIYIAIPEAMSVSGIIQPDALNAPLVIEQAGEITRTLGDNAFVYKLYKSVDTIDCSKSKRLAIS